MKRFWWLISLLAGCEQQLSQPGQFSVADLLGAETESEFLRAEGPRSFSFPADHGLHPGFRNEWWYFTGNLHGPEGRRFGYQVTFFTNGIEREPHPLSSDSDWLSDRIWMAHVALTDVSGGSHQAVERFSRESPGLAGIRETPLVIWQGDWRVVADNEGFPWQLTAKTESFTLKLDLGAGKSPVLQGENGLSRKNGEAGNASYYYSMTRMPTEGSVEIGRVQIPVSGQSWLDREWGTSALASDQSGWDWFSLQFDSGEELMYYQIRDLSGEAHPYSAGNYTDTRARQQPILPGDIRLLPLKEWISPAGVSYTTQWSVDYEGQSWIIRAVLDDQWMDVSIRYWEGAVDILAADTGEVLGYGYLEMVRSP